VTVAVGPSFYPYASPVYERCCSIVQQQLLQYQTFQQNPEMDEPDKDFLVVTIDLLSGLVQGLGMQMKTLLDNSNPPLFSLIGICLKVSGVKSPYAWDWSEPSVLASTAQCPTIIVCPGW
jgi:transportin-1